MDAIALTVDAGDDAGAALHENATNVQLDVHRTK